MSTTMTPPAESSPATAAPEANATFSIPKAHTPEYATWRQTGETPEQKAAPKQAEESATSEGKSAEGEKPEEKSAPASEAGKKTTQETKPSKADSRLNEILDDLREAGLTPKALKSFKQDWTRAQQQAEPSKQTAPEQTDKPAESGLKAPVKPKAEDFEGKPWTEYEAAKDKYYEDLADYKAAARIESNARQQAQEAQQREMTIRLNEAAQRYKSDENAVTTITETATKVFNDAKVNGVVKALVNDSPVMVDLLYVVGTKTPEFIKTAQENPGRAIREIVLIEKLILEELAGTGAEASKSETTRGEDGKFQKTTPVTTKTTQAPPPPKEVSGQRAAPPDESEAAYKSGNFRAFRDAENRKELRKLRGN